MHRNVAARYVHLLLCYLIFFLRSSSWECLTLDRNVWISLRIWSTSCHKVGVLEHSETEIDYCPLVNWPSANYSNSTTKLLT